MTPEEMEALQKLNQDIELANERKLGLCRKMYHFFFEREEKSSLETYLQIKEEGGATADYSAVDNETILRNYGVVIPD